MLLERLSAAQGSHRLEQLEFDVLAALDVLRREAYASDCAVFVAIDAPATREPAQAAIAMLDAQLMILACLARDTAARQLFHERPVLDVHPQVDEVGGLETLMQRIACDPLGSR